jgi:hypothetical protein
VTTTVRKPRFNHVAMSVPADLLDEAGRKDLVEFYGDVFGFDELPTETEDRKKLVMRAYSNEQFLYLIADDPPMSAPRLDHFGMSVATMEELDDMLDRAKKFRERDDRVDIIDKKADDFEGFLTLTSFYVRYRLPMMIEVQHFNWPHGNPE